MNLIIPENYDPVLDLRQTQEAIKYIRDTFQKEIGRALHLSRISAPLFVQKSSGLNDNLNGFESPVSFKMYKNTKAVAQIYGFCYYYRSISNSIFWAISSDVGNSFL